jgi:hypothetical protein
MAFDTCNSGCGNSMSTYIVVDGKHRLAAPSPNGDGSPPNGRAVQDKVHPAPRDFRIVCNPDGQILLYKVVQLKVSWASPGCYPIALEPLAFDLVTLGPPNDRAAEGISATTVQERIARDRQLSLMDWQIAGAKSGAWFG